MTYHFRMASEITEPLHTLVALAGGSGCGKTYSALALAEGLADGETFAVIDTEAGRAMHYRSRFDFAHCDFTPFDDKGDLTGYSPERYIDVLDAAEKAGYPVIVIDSFSHVWEGIGGVLELHAEAVDRMARGDDSKRDRVSMIGWAGVKPRYRRLLHRLIQCRAHVILCIRAKERPEGIKSVSKIRRPDLRWDVAADKDLVFEMTSSLLLLPEMAGVPIPIKLNDEHRRAFPHQQQINAKSGAELLAWSKGEIGTGDKDLIDRARAAARQGYDAINQMWKKLGEGDRDKLMPLMKELKTIAAEAERGVGDAPFGPDGSEDKDEGAAHQRETERQAEREIAVMEATAADYRKTTDLFAKEGITG